MHVESVDSVVNPGHQFEWWTPRLAWPVIAAAVVRLTVMAVALEKMGTSTLTHADTCSYLIPGRNLLLHGQFMADGVPDLLRSPGYPLFLAITSLAGLPAAALVNVILSVFSVVLVWKLGRAVFDDDRIALGAAWIFAFEPGSVTASSTLISETLFLVLYLLSMERLAEFLRGRRLPALAAAGLWLAAATFVRPVTYYLPVFLALGLFIVLARVPGLRWKAPAVLLICVMPWLAAWQIRNRVETGYSGFSSISDENLYFLAAADVTARVEHRFPRDVSQQLGYGDFTGNSGQSYLFQPYLALHPEQTKWNQAQRLAYLHSEAVRIIRAHYGIYLRSCLIDLLKTVSYPSTYELSRLKYSGSPTYGSHTYAAVIADEGLGAWRIILARAQVHPWVIAENAVFGPLLVVLYLFTVRGFYFVTRGVFRGGIHSACLWLLLGMSLYCLVVSMAATGALPSTRMRLPVMPVICILAAAGFLRAKTMTIAT
ncbi:MAG: hypothetical protein ABSC77_12015 [Terracidiphilus sp.]|jgi:hypothetical protein